MILPRSVIKRLGLRMLPFSDAASDQLPMPRLLRLSLFQVSCGMAMVLMLGTLNRVMIVELGLAASIVAVMVALPILIAPIRTILGHRSDTHRSAIGWKRVPYIWFGSLWQMGGLAVMPFALLVLSGQQQVGPEWAGEALAALAFLMTGLGMHMTQTAGLALAADLATEETRPRVVALLYVMFLAGMAVSAVIIGALLRDFSSLRLVQVVQGAALMTLLLNLVSLWKQERLAPMSRAERAEPKQPLREAWADLSRDTGIVRLLTVVVLGTMALSMQDVLLEPYGGEILSLSVSATTLLTAMWAGGALVGFWLAGRWLRIGLNVHRISANGLLIGIVALAAVVFAAPLDSAALFFAGAGGIGLGTGLFGVATLIAAMTMPVSGKAGRGLVLGAWGAAQATAAGLAVAAGGGLRDVIGSAASSGLLGTALNQPSTGYSFVYHLEIGLCFAALVAIGPLVRHTHSFDATSARNSNGIGLAEFPT
ncbi:MAG: MFS transporter [Pseudomonadota bacterium]